MAMSIAALEALEKADFAPQQARALTHVLEMEASARFETLATKADLAIVKSDLEKVRLELKSEMTGLRSEVALQIKDVKSEVSELRQSLRVEIQTTQAENMRFTLLATFGQVAMLAGLMYFFLENLR